MARNIIGAVLLLVGFAAQPGHAANGWACPRPAPGTEVLPPHLIYSSNGKLDVALNYNTALTDEGVELFCFVTSDGINRRRCTSIPETQINIKLTNNMARAPGAPAMTVSDGPRTPGNSTMLLTSTNMHFHGINASPKCHSDEVIRTLVNPGQTFTYKIKIPKNEPPGLYWYHPHVPQISLPAYWGAQLARSSWKA